MFNSSLTCSIVSSLLVHERGCTRRGGTGRPSVVMSALEGWANWLQETPLVWKPLEGRQSSPDEPEKPGDTTATSGWFMKGTRRGGGEGLPSVAMSTLDRERVLLLETHRTWNPFGPRQPGNPGDTTSTHTTTSAPSGQTLDEREWLAALERRYRAPPAIHCPPTRWPAAVPSSAPPLPSVQAPPPRPSSSRCRANGARRLSSFPARGRK